MLTVLIYSTFFGGGGVKRIKSPYQNFLQKLSTMLLFHTAYNKGEVARI